MGVLLQQETAQARAEGAAVPEAVRKLMDEAG
jgi:hypothetical protein